MASLSSEIVSPFDLSKDPKENTAIAGVLAGRCSPASNLWPAIQGLGAHIACLAEMVGAPIEDIESPYAIRKYEGDALVLRVLTPCPVYYVQRMDDPKPAEDHPNVVYDCEGRVWVSCDQGAALTDLDCAELPPVTDDEVDDDICPEKPEDTSIGILATFTETHDEDDEDCPEGEGGCEARHLTLQQLRTLVDPFDATNRWGLCSDGETDNSPAWADLYAELNRTHWGRLEIKPGKYHFSQKIELPWSEDLFHPSLFSAYGAEFDNTVVVGLSTSTEGYRVVGAPDAGTVYLRGQGATHHDIVSDGCVYGFAFSVATRQLITLNKVTGLNVGDDITTAAGNTGTITSIDGNVVEIGGINQGGIPVMFEVGDTIGRCVITAVDSCYGDNFQVTRTSFTSLYAVNSVNKGVIVDESSTAVARNPSWVNHNTFETVSVVNSGGKAWVVQSPNDDTGGTGFAYNVIENFGSEVNNGDLSFLMNGGVANTFIGGHFSSTDPAGNTVVYGNDARENRHFGGRYVGPIIAGGTTGIGITTPVILVNTAAAGFGAAQQEIYRIDELIARNGTAEITGGVPVGGV